MRRQEKALLAFSLVLLGIAALSNPQCQGGCKTWAEHFITHGLKALV